MRRQMVKVSVGLALIYALVSSSKSACVDIYPEKCYQHVQNKMNTTECYTWAKKYFPLSCGLCDKPTPVCDNEVEEEWCKIAQEKDLCWGFFYKDRCKNTCGVCARAVELPCKDVRGDWCRSKELDCYNSHHEDDCKKTCGACGLFPAGVCADDLDKEYCTWVKQKDRCQGSYLNSAFVREYFKDHCRKTCELCGRRSPFPLKPNTTSTTSTWSWAHDGTNENGIVELLADGTVTWKGGEKEGYWKLNEEKTVLEIYMGLVHHKLEYDGDQGKAILISPVRSPFTTMKLITSD